MIVLILKKDREVIKFSTSNKQREEALVNKFILGSVKQKSMLNLPQLDRKIMVADILDMKFVDVDKMNQERAKQNAESQKSFADDLMRAVNGGGMFGDSGYDSLFKDIFGGKS